MPRAPISPLLLAAVAALFAALALVSQTPPANTFVFAAGGDMIGPWRSLKGIDDPKFRQVASLFQHANLGFANQEGSIFGLATFPGFEHAGAEDRPPRYHCKPA